MIKYKIGKMADQRGFSARGLAKEAQISPNTVAMLMKAKTHKDYNVCADVIDKICRVLKCKLGDLLEYKKK